MSLCVSVNVCECGYTCVFEQVSVYVHTACSVYKCMYVYAEHAAHVSEYVPVRTHHTEHVRVSVRVDAPCSASRTLYLHRSLCPAGS